MDIKWLYLEQTIVIRNSIAGNRESQEEIKATQNTLLHQQFFTCMGMQCFMRTVDRTANRGAAYNQNMIRKIAVNVPKMLDAGAEKISLKGRCVILCMNREGLTETLTAP